MRILVVDDDFDSLDALSGFLRDPLDYEVSSFRNCEKAYEVYQENPFPLVISDIKMPGMNGIDLLRKIKNSPAGPETDVILLTGFGELQTCMEALREGASDYLLKPVYVHQLDQVIRRVIEKRKLNSELLEAKEQIKQQYETNKKTSLELNQFKKIFSDLIEGEKIGIFSDKMKDIIDISKKLHKDRSIPVLIEGETGTGKEVIARLIHQGQNDEIRPFITINCAAISPSLFESELFGYEKGAFTGAGQDGSSGKLELAQNGTIFLDEIGDMPLEMQPKLLRAIQEKEIYRVGGKKKIKLDVRLICATNQSLQTKVDKNQFRSDLFYRINSGYLFIPPLRERKQAIAPLSRMLLLDLSRQKNKKFESIDREAIFLLENYPWPGNVRELKNTLERVCLLYDEKILKIEHLNFLIMSSYATDHNKLTIDLDRESFPLKEFEYLIATKVHRKFDGNINQAARFLNVAWATFVKMARLK